VTWRAKWNLGFTEYLNRLITDCLILITPAAGSGISSSYRRPMFVSSCCIRPLKQPASWYAVIHLLDRLLPQTKAIPVPPTVSRHFALTIHISWSLWMTLTGIGESAGGRFWFLVPLPASDGADATWRGRLLPASPRRICTVTRGFQTTTWDLSVFLFLPRHYHMTRVLLSPFITTVWTPVVLAMINII